VPSDLSAEQLNALRTIVRWAKEFLTHPHPDLGRRGPVCPWVRGALARGTFWLALHEGAGIDQAGAIEVMNRYRDLHAALCAGPGDTMKTIVVLFPDIPREQAPEVIDEVQRILKPGFVARGLMVGQFHPDCPEPGLRNPRFRPLQAPVPLLVVRSMVAGDRPFLAHDRRFLCQYEQRFADVAQRAA
jgi:hypothetical protein